VQLQLRSKDVPESIRSHGKHIRWYLMAQTVLVLDFC
jgi:hypothetical protein